MSDEPNPIQNEPPLTVEQAIANLQGEDLGLRMYAAWWLGKFRVREAKAIAGLIQALTDEADRTPDGGYPLRRNAARALGKLGDRQAVQPLMDSLNCTDFYVREAAAQSLGRLGDPICITSLVEIVNLGVAGEQLRNKADFSQPYDAAIEALGSLEATNAVPLIQLFLEHQIDRVRCAAARAMYQLTRDSSYGDILVTALSGGELQVRRAVLADLGAIGYLPAAEPIAATLAENSLKLISLKGILESEIELSPSDRLSDGAVRVMELMDGLL
jgi:phycocyanobilin lyase alpha subunit